MSNRKSMKLPVIITFIIIAVIVFLFTRIKQTEVVCEKTYNFDSGISLNEKVVATLDGKEINKLDVTKTIMLPEKYIKDENYVNDIKNNLDRTLSYLGDKVNYSILDDRIIVEISVKTNEIVLLKNIKFEDKKIVIDSNTKSSEVVTLAVGDDYTDGEFMKTLKGLGYSCK